MVSFRVYSWRQPIPKFQTQIFYYIDKMLRSLTSKRAALVLPLVVLSLCGGGVYASAATATTTTTTTATTTTTTATSSETSGGLWLDGVHLSETKYVNGTLLTRNGEGVRSVPFLGLTIKVYVAGFYTATPPLRTFQEVLDCPGPHQLDFCFVRSVGQSRVKQAWSQQLDASVSYRYPGYEQDRNDFIAMFGPIATGGTETVQFLDRNTTVVIDQGTVKGVIHGHDFQKAFLSMWFGDQPVTTELKDGLLGLLRPTNVQVSPTGTLA